jgi:hypothetical protein
MKKTLIILLFLSINCSDNNDNLKSATMNGKPIFTLFPLQEICYDGVVYLIGQHFSSVKFNKNGKIETCQ